MKVHFHDHPFQKNTTAGIVQSFKWVSLKEKKCLKVHNRALWHESWNWDKLLQYSVSKLNVSDFSWNTLLRVFQDSAVNNLVD